MGAIDENGVYIYDTNDQVAPLATLLNLGQSSISQAFTQQREDIIEELTPEASGWVTGNFLYGVTGWTNAGDASQTRIRRNGNRVYIQVRMRRSGAALSVPADTGDLTDQEVVQVREAWRPAYGQPLHSQQRLAGLTIGTDGIIRLHSISGTKNIATDDVFNILGTYYLD